MDYCFMIPLLLASGTGHNDGVINGVDYDQWRVSWYGAIGNLEYARYVTHAYYGKGEADSEDEYDAYVTADPL